MNVLKFAAIFYLVALLTACASGPGTKSSTIFYPPPPETPRLQFLTSITTEDDLAGKSNAFRTFLVGEEEKVGKRIARPWGIAHEEGKIYIGDKTVKKVLILDLETGEFDYIRDVKGGELQDANGVFVDADGYKYVADLVRGQVVVFNERNEYSHAYGEEKQFGPIDVVVYGDKVYVADLHQSEVEVLDKATGEVIDTIGGIGKAPGTFNKPTHLSIDPAGNLFVTDGFNFRYQMFDADGNYVKTLGWEGGGPGGVARPKGLAIDRAGHLYTVDAAMQIIQVFDVESQDPLLGFGKFGPAAGSSYLPVGVHIDYDNVRYFDRYADPNFEIEYLVYVGNTLGDKKLNVYGFGRWQGGSLEGYAEPIRAPAGENPIPGLDNLDAEPD